MCVVKHVYGEILEKLGPQFVDVSVEKVEPLERVNAYKYLGLMLSSNLPWSQHVNTKARKHLGLSFLPIILCS